MKLWIDADACPVVNEAIGVAKNHHMPTSALIPSV